MSTIDDRIRSVVLTTSFVSCIFEIRQWMREVSRVTPRHGEHQMDGYSQSLRAVYACKARRVGDDGVSDERISGTWIGLDT